MPKIVIEVDSSDTAEIRKIIEQLKKQVKENRNQYSELVHEQRLKMIAPGIEPFIPHEKLKSVLNLGVHCRYEMEMAGIDTLDDVIKMSRKDLILITNVGHMVVNEIDSFLWTEYGMRLPKNSNRIS